MGEIFWGSRALCGAPPPPCIQPIPSLHHILFLLMWKISSAVPCPPFWPARLSWKLHPACVGVDRVGSKREEMVTGDSGLCLSPCSCVSNPYPAAAPRPRPPPPHPVPWHPCLSAFLLQCFPPLVLSPSQISLTPIAVSPPFPASPSLQLPPLPPLGWLPFCLQPGPHLPQGPREAWPGHDPLPTRLQELEFGSS